MSCEGGIRWNVGGGGNALVILTGGRIDGPVEAELGHTRLDKSGGTGNTTYSMADDVDSCHNHFGDLMPRSLVMVWPVVLGIFTREAL